jgi:Domain of unknown function (DUF4157)
VIKLDKRSVSAIILACYLFVQPTQIYASWLSDITGININVPAGRITIGPPRPDRIPQMLQNLPKDAAQFFLNPVGSSLAFAIRQAKEQAKNGCQPVPATIIQTLSRFLPTDVFNGVCWNTYGQRFALDSILLRDMNMGAVTLEDVIVFQDGNQASRPELWAHEMIHVLQYRRLGLESFANIYTYDFNSIEGEAYGFQNLVNSQISVASQNGSQIWSTMPGWNSSRQISLTQYQDSAKQTINPFTCSNIHTDGANFVLTNGCPIPIKVQYFIMVNPYTNQAGNTPCTTPLCIVNPGTWQSWPEPPGLVTNNAFIVW